MAAPEPPAHLSGVALERWQTIWNEIDPTRVTERHADSVALYCQSYAAFQSANEQINRFGVVVVRDKRATVSPYIIVRDNAIRTMMELSKSLGLSPDIVQAPIVDWNDYIDTIAEDENERGTDDAAVGDIWSSKILDRPENRVSADSVARLDFGSGEAARQDIQSEMHSHDDHRSDESESETAEDSGNVLGNGAGHLRVGSD